METWKEFEANDLTHSAAHHLMAIHELGQQYGGWARVSDIARHLKITRGSVSINLRTLKKRELVVTDEHHMVKLSDEGERIVHGVKAKKSAVKAFLSDVLGLDEEQAEIDSCKIEHLLSQHAAERLIHFIRFLESDQIQDSEALRGFEKFHKQCASDAECPICGGPCLVDEQKIAS